MKNDLFINVIVKTLIGAVLGIAAGFMLGIVIYGFSTLIPLIIPGSNGSPSDAGGIFPILGMCFGALFGAMFGGHVAFRSAKK